MQTINNAASEYFSFECGALIGDWLRNFTEAQIWPTPHTQSIPHPFHMDHNAQDFGGYADICGNNSCRLLAGPWKAGKLSGENIIDKHGRVLILALLIRAPLIRHLIYECTDGDSIRLGLWPLSLANLLNMSRILWPQSRSLHWG